MSRKTLFAWTVVCAAVVSGCSGNPETPLTPSGTTDGVTFVNSDGSTIKAPPPTNLSPNGTTLDTRRPTLSFSNPNPSAKYVGVGFFYEIEIQNAAGNVIYTSNTGETSGTSTHTVQIDLDYATTLWWRVRPRLSFENQIGPWSVFAQIRTPNPPPPPTPPVVQPPVGGGLPFAVPAACGPFGPGNRVACVQSMAALSVEWGRCAGGSGVGCHRFTRQVVYALALSDPNWKLIQAAPGGQACNCNSCGPSDGTMFREDTTVYGGNRVFDLIVGAGGPSPSFNWSEVPGPRAGDLPADAPLCVP